MQPFAAGFDVLFGDEVGPLVGLTVDDIFAVDCTGGSVVDVFPLVPFAVLPLDLAIWRTNNTANIKENRRYCCKDFIFVILSFGNAMTLL